MSSAHSWQWLTPRMTSRTTIAGTSPPSRPPLAAIESLDDRVMLSVAPVTGGDNNSTAILIGLLKGSTSLVQNELSFLKFVSAANARQDKWMPQLTTDFLKIDGLLYKFGDSLIKGELNQIKIGSIQQSVNDIFLKIGDLLPAISPSSEVLSPALNKVREAANGIIAALSRFPVGQSSHKDSQPLIKLSQDFLKIDTLFLKLGEDLLIKDHLVQDKAFYIKLQGLFQKMDGSVIKLGLADQLLPAVQDAQKQINATLSDLGGNFTGGPTIQTSGDVIG